MASEFQREATHSSLVAGYLWPEAQGNSTKRLFPLNFYAGKAGYNIKDSGFPSSSFLLLFRAEGEWGSGRVRALIKTHTNTL